MKKLTRWYGLLLIGYLLFVLILMLMLPGCGKKQAEPSYAPAPEQESAELIQKLPETDWKEYAAQYGQEAAVELLGQLKAYVEENELSYDDTMKVMTATRGLDGAGAEGYAALMESVYGSNPCKFLRCFWLISADDQAELLPFLAYITGEFDPELSAKWMDGEYQRLQEAWTAAELFAQQQPPVGRQVESYEFPEMYSFDPYFAEDYTSVSDLYDQTMTAYGVVYPLTDGGSYTIYVDGNGLVYGYVVK